MQNHLNILIVEDEPNLGATLNEYLSTKGHQCQLATTAKMASQYFSQTNDLQVILMDIGLPDGDGLSLAQAFRSQRKDFVLLFLSALNDPETKLTGLEMGADDYITKPFDLRELNLRLERILKMNKLASDNQTEITIGPLKIWFKRFEVQNAQGEIINLNQKECGILELLFRKKNQVVSRDEIISHVWGEGQYPSNRTVDNYIVGLRKWSETDPSENLKITSVRGIGYKLETK